MRFVTQQDDQSSELRIARDLEFDGGTTSAEELSARVRLQATSGDAENTDQYTFMQVLPSPPPATAAFATCCVYAF